MKALGDKFVEPFSSPIGESTFSTKMISAINIFMRIVFVPYRGIYFLYVLEKHHIFGGPNVFVPYRGIYFLYGEKIWFVQKLKNGFRPLSGNLLSLPPQKILLRGRTPSFRPLSGNLLSLHDRSRSKGEGKLPFSSPIGESTFSTNEVRRIDTQVRKFSSPIGESTFSTVQNVIAVMAGVVFVPYRGIYFLYDRFFG